MKTDENKWNPLEALEHELYEVTMKDGKKVVWVRGYMCQTMDRWAVFMFQNFKNLFVPLDRVYKDRELLNIIMEKELVTDKWAKDYRDREAIEFLVKTYGPDGEAKVLPYSEVTPETPVGVYITGRTKKH